MKPQSLHCVEHKQGREICGVADFMQSTNIALEGLMQFKNEATSKLDKIEHLETSLNKVANHAESMDKTLGAMEATARELIGIATGKKQVPITIFYLVIVVLGGWMLVDKLASARGSLQLSPTGFSYSAEQREQRQQAAQ